jgi:hypothetical protein
MKSFKELNIQAAPKPFSGKRYDVERLIGQEIIISAFKIGPSKFPKKGNGMRLDMQITVDGEERITWTSGVALQEQILQVPEAEFPFKTTMIRANGRFEFS